MRRRREFVSNDTLWFSIDEFELMVRLIANNLNADKFPHPEAKAVIYKCKGALESRPDYVGVR